MIIKTVNTPLGLACTDNRNYYIGGHIRLLFDKLMGVYNGTIKKLIIEMPPRHGKSELTSKYFPAWWLLNRPQDKIMLTSYEADFASSWGGRVRELLREYGGIFGVEINSLIDARNRFETLQKGGMTTAGVGGSITGKGADLIIIDDPVKNDSEANSPTYRKNAWNWFRSTIYSRLEPNAKIVVIMTRWHHDDLVGKIKSELEGWDVLSLPALAKENDIIGRRPGAALWADRYSQNALKDIKETIGSYWFSALYQQEPITSEFQIFKPSYWKYGACLNPKMTVQSWDTAFKEKEQNDYSVCTTWQYNGSFYLIDCFKRKLKFTDLVNKSIDLYNAYKPDVVLIEDKATGTPLIDTLKDKNIPVKRADPKGRDKILRAHLASPYFENGSVYIKQDNWTHEVIEEMALFPAGAHDDIVDSVMYALEYMSKTPGKFKASTKKEKRDLFSGYL